MYSAILVLRDGKSTDLVVLRDGELLVKIDQIIVPRPVLENQTESAALVRGEDHMFTGTILDHEEIASKLERACRESIVHQLALYCHFRHHVETAWVNWFDDACNSFEDVATYVQNFVVPISAPWRSLLDGMVAPESCNTIVSPLSAMLPGWQF